MSSKSFISSASTGGTVVSSHSSSSSRRRKNRLPQDRVPPQFMGKQERLTLIRNSISRLKYIQERVRHTVSLDQSGGDEVMEVFLLLQEAIPQLEETPASTGDTTKGPQRLQELKGRVKEYLTRVSEAVRRTEKDHTALAVYPGLKRKLLLESQQELNELSDLLALKDGEAVSRINTDALSDMIAIHTRDFDAFFDTRVNALVEERYHEHAFLSRAVKDGFSTTAKPCGSLSVLLLGVHVGVRPSSCAHAVLQNAVKLVHRAKERITSSTAILRTLKDKEGENTVEFNLEKQLLLLEKVTTGHNHLMEMQSKWKAEEEEIFKNAFDELDLNSLVRQKRQKEEDTIQEALRLYDELMYYALPFVSPQYCRRYSETYSNPCLIRVGVRLAPDTANPEFEHCSPLMLYNSSPLFLKLMQEKKIPDAAFRDYECLVPSSDQLWLPFADFPEMVGGRRCVLNGLKAKEDRFRAVEEVKEMGGYFIVNGGERILRALQVQRNNVPLNVTRPSFAGLGPHFSEHAVMVRCKRQSGRTQLNFFYYSKAGDILLSMSRRGTWQIPAILLLLATAVRNPSTKELYNLLVMGMETSANHADRVQTILQNHLAKPYGHLFHYLDYLAVLGRVYVKHHEGSSRYRFLPEYISGTKIQHDAWYGLHLLRTTILPHLNVSVSTPSLSPFATPEEMEAWLCPELLEELDRKFDALLASMRQLLAFNDKQTCHQGVDVPAYQEIFTSSQVLMCAFSTALMLFERPFVTRLASSLSYSLFTSLLKREMKPLAENMKNFRVYVNQSTKGAGLSSLDPIRSLLLSGNMKVDEDRDFHCPQTTGWSVLAEHLNFYRFFEQLRCVHRGSDIAKMRSSDVRKYPCEAYGFICMVHSPDGGDCGVLNHLSVSTVVSSGLDQMTNTPKLYSSSKEDVSSLNEWLTEAFPVLRVPSRDAVSDVYVETVPVWVEGRIIGYVLPEDAEKGVRVIRRRKAITKKSMVDITGIVSLDTLTPLHTLEVVFIPPKSKEPKGVYIFSDSGRLMRPIQRIESFQEETTTLDLPFPLMYVGTWEQMWLDIAAVPSDLTDAVVQLNRKYEYMEQNGTNIISLTSTTIPFFEYNCSPRNLFQCGLNKQSSGTQLQALGWRREAKLFRTYFPQRYISRTLPMDYYNLDDVNLGVNAVVAILAYTGYDMDDAVILNSTASQRGMLNACVTVGKVITASGNDTLNDGETYVFQNLLSTGERVSPQLEANGLPPKRTFAHLEELVNFTTDHQYPSLHNSTDIYCVAKRVKSVDHYTNQSVYEYSDHKATKWERLDKGEDGWVHSVIPLAYDGPDPVSVLMVFRLPRPPAVGDKFSSRHGQKGTLPLHIRSHDLPYSSQTGITPDIIINPHAFPSRMTVGMMLEMMTAKVGSIEGRFIDNSAWSTVDEMPRVAVEIGDALLKSGYNRYGREKFIDGISGEEMEAEVFVGVCGYQRLRHQVYDKWQARARTDSRKYRAVTKTGQPVKGRKNHGGIRVGEMERDALLSYGMSEVVLDRLVRVSDETLAYICTECGSLLSIVERYASEHSTWKCCVYCGAGKEESSDTIAMVMIPQVLRLWAAELTSIGVRVVLRVE